MKITRRSFVEGMVAMMTLAGVSRPAVSAPRSWNVNPFTAPDYRRYNLSSPFASGSHLVATDGFKLLRLHNSAKDSACDVENVPNVDFLPFDAFESNEGWKPFRSKIISVTESVCHECLGLGWLGDVRWERVDFRNEAEWLRYQHITNWVIDSESDDLDLSCLSGIAKAIDAMDRDGDSAWVEHQWHSDQPCVLCRARGYLVGDHATSHVIDESIFDGGHLKAILQLGQIEYRLEPFSKTIPKEPLVDGKLMLFRGDGFDGMILNRRKH